jgi:hypothetical protein
MITTIHDYIFFFSQLSIFCKCLFDSWFICPSARLVLLLFTICLTRFLRIFGNYLFLLHLVEQPVPLPQSASVSSLLLFPAFSPSTMAPASSRGRNAANAIKMSDLYARDSVPSLKSSELVNETQRQAGSIDPNHLNKEELVLWFFHLRHANRQMIDQLTVSQAALKKEKAASASLQLALSSKSDLHQIKKFESDSLQNFITASNMRIILLEMGFPSLSVSFNFSRVL